MCCGTGLFSTSVGLEVPEIKSIDAIELNQEALTIARIRAYLIDLGGKMKVHGGDVFDLCDDKASYEKIFCHPPWGLRLKGNAPVESFLSRLPVSLPQMKNSISSDWLFALRALYSLKDGGRAVIIMTNSAVWNQPDADIRKFLLERHFVEAVVSLPSKIYQWTAIPTTLVVLSKKDNTSVKLLDATKMCVEGRRMNELSDENIRDILMTVYDEMPMACPAFPVEELISRESILNPLFYTGDDFTEKDMPNAVEFGTVMKSVTRGATINATELDRLESNAPTNFQYLMLSNIQNGMIDSELPYLKDVERKLLPYCIKDGDLIVSKMGRPLQKSLSERHFSATAVFSSSKSTRRRPILTICRHSLRANEERHSSSVFVLRLSCRPFRSDGSKRSRFPCRRWRNKRKSPTVSALRSMKWHSIVLNSNVPSTRCARSTTRP